MPKRQSLRAAKKRSSARRQVDPVGEAAPTPEVASHVLLSMQRQFGNAEVARMLARRRGDEEDLGPTTFNEGRTNGISTERHDRAEDVRAVGTKTRDSAQEASPAFLQREVTKKLQHGSISLSAVAVLFDNGGKVVEARPFNGEAREVSFTNALKPGDAQTNHGSVRLDITSTWDFDLTGPSVVTNKGTARLVVDTPLHVLDKVKEDESPIKFKQPRFTGQESSGRGAALDPTPQAMAEPDEAGGSVTVSPRVTFQEQNATAASLGFPPFSGQTQNQSTDTQAFGTSFTARVQVAAGAEPPGPQPPGPQPGPKKDSSPKVLTSFGRKVFFDVNKRVPSAQEVALLKAWWNGQNPDLLPMPNQEARDAVRAGQTEVFVIGHASQTGSREYNLVLSKDRADSVVQVLRQDDVMGGGAKIQQAGSGRDEAKKPGEAQTDRSAKTIFEALVSAEPTVTDSAATPAASPGTTALNDVDT